MNSISLIDWAKMTTIFAQGLVTGTAYYISMVQAPGWLNLDAVSGVKAWRPSFIGAKNSQIVVSTISILGGLAIYYLEYGTAKESILWPIASALLAFNIPYTLVVIMPLNYQLLETEKCIEKGEGWIKSSLSKWAKIHAPRTLTNIVAFALMVYAGYTTK